MRLLARSFIRRALVVVVASGLAMAASLLALHSYFTLTSAIRAQSEVITSGGWPADGWLTSLDRISVEEQEYVAQTPGVVDFTFSAQASVETSAGAGWVQGVDFADSFFSFGLKTGRLPERDGEALVDAAYARVAGIRCGDRVSVRVPLVTGERTVQLTITGILGPDAVAPRGALVTRSFCVESLAGKLNRVWIRTASPDGAKKALDELCSRIPLSYYETIEDWIGRSGTASGGSYDLLAIMVVVLALAVLVVLWVLAQFSVSHSAAILRTAYALGVSPGGLALLLSLEGMAAGATAATVLTSAVWLARWFPALAAFTGGQWTIPVGFLLPSVVTTLIGFRVVPEIESGILGKQ